MIEIGQVYPFYKIPIGTIIDYGFFKVKPCEKISKDTIKQLSNDKLFKIQLTHATYQIIKPPAVVINPNS